MESQSTERDLSVHSAPNADYDQFLLLRVLCEPLKLQTELYKPHQRCLWLPDEYFDTAKSILNSQDSWLRYIKSFSPQLNIHKFPDLGTFSLVRYYQSIVHGERISELDLTAISEDETDKPRLLDKPTDPRTAPRINPRKRKASGNYSLPQFLRSSSDASSNISDVLSPAVSPLIGASTAHFPDVVDEQIVNMALLLYLNTITIHCRRVQGEWTLHRHPFRLESTKEKVYEARVDGYFQTYKDSEVKAIIELKPYLRSKKSREI
jgi:hypothetical protein